MKQWIPALTVLSALLFMSDAMPKMVYILLWIILILLVLNRWNVLENLFT